MHNNTLLKRLIIVTGGFGSGKTEYSINLALSLAVQKKENPVLVDFDLVNAYFRSREAKLFLENQGIKTVVPPHEVIHSDLPVAGPGIRDLILNKYRRVIVDAGGNETGATPLRSYCREIRKAEHSSLMLVNPFRPFTRSVKEIRQMKEGIETSSGLQINGIVSNPNIGVKTDIKQVIEKHRLVEEAAHYLQIPLIELAVLAEIYAKNQAELARINCPVRPIKIYLCPQWLWKQQARGELIWP
ncbi:MAG: hypothetical protein H5T98_02510 [Syntrophomonadaceae bacterium]|nr:hypothetical protein [Syntrophomonadaceae bacterium]